MSSEKDVVGAGVDILTKIYDQAEVMIKQYGPDVVDLTMLTYQVKAIHIIVYYTIALILCIIGAKVAFKLVNSGSKAFKERGCVRDEDGVPSMVGGTILGAFSFIFGIGSIIKLADPFVFIAAFGRPELYMFRSLLQSQGLM